MNLLAPLHHSYEGLTFGQFFLRLFGRIQEAVTGQITDSHLAADELQIIVLSFVAISSALVGTFLVLRRMTMLANALSHTILLGIAIAYFFVGTTQGVGMEAMLIASLFMGVITSFLTQLLNRVTSLQEDASIGLVFIGLFALGVISATILTRDAHIGIEAVMGNADALHPDDMIWVFWVAILNGVSFVLFFKEFTITSFDPLLAKSMGFSTAFFTYFLMLQTSATTMSAFRAVGVILVLALMTGPPLIARLFTHRLAVLLAASCGIGCGTVVCGVALARHLLSTYGMALSTGGVVVSLLFFIYLVCFGINLIKRWKAQTQCEA